MPNKQINSQIKSNPKEKAIASTVLGVISILGNVILFASLISFRLSPFWKGIFSTEIMTWITLIFFYLEWILPLLGIILGIKGLKSMKKNLAKLGIILSSCGLVGYIYIIWLIVSIYSK
jgi:hypothetical protein